MVIKEFDTIAAISTAVGGPVGIVRLSGGNTLAVLNKIFVPAHKDRSDIKSHRIYYGHVLDGDQGEIVDEVLVSFMKGPRSYTCEDVAEINCHGGVQSLQRILKVVLSAGARMADPGEFTKRAFLNGRIDLTQAAAVIDVINAKTDMAQKAAVNRLEGKLSREVRKYRETILNLLALIEVSIDYPEHGMEEDNLAGIDRQVREIIEEMELLLSRGNTGKILREGIETVILGRPNVGKSSLLNALLDEDRAIVTDIPGTTRDILQEYVNIKGIPLKIVDTAGIRQTQDAVETLGVEKSRRYGAKADLVLFMLDASAPLHEEDIEIGKSLKDQQAIVLLNKTDLDFKVNIAAFLEGLGRELPVIPLSLKNQEGLEALEEKLKEMFFGGELTLNSEILLGNARDQDLVRRAVERLKAVVSAAEQGFTEDLIAIDLNEAYSLLGEILGETVGEEVIDKIFSEFCLGK